MISSIVSLLVTNNRILFPSQSQFTIYYTLTSFLHNHGQTEVIKGRTDDRKRLHCDCYFENIQLNISVTAIFA